MSPYLENNNIDLIENTEIAEDIEINQNPTKIEPAGSLLYKIIKRIIDIIGGIVGTILLIPVTIVIAIARKVTKEDDGPLFYDQLRIGKNGKQFKLYKYRSMVTNADDYLEDYLSKNEDARIEYQKYKKLENDPRITKVGNFMRKLSLDEFPQFINVLKGEMSLVGPRPYLPREKKDMKDRYEAIVKVKPGITGFWQINGRNDIDFEERTQMDINYIRTRTLWFDIKILLRTVFKVFDKEGK